MDDIAANLPELPDAKRARFISDFGLSEYDASVLTAETASADFFEHVAAGHDGKMAANWVINELFGRLKKDDLEITSSPVSPAQLAGVIGLIASGGSRDIGDRVATLASINCTCEGERCGLADIQRADVEQSIVSIVSRARSRCDVG